MILKFALAVSAVATPMVAADRPGTPAEIAAAAKSCAAAVSATSITEGRLVRDGWSLQSRPSDATGGQFRRAGVDMILTTAALPGANFCAIRARIAGESEFPAIANAVGKSLHAKNAMKTFAKLAAERPGEAYFDTRSHSVTLSAISVEGGPGIQISLLPKR